MTVLDAARDIDLGPYRGWADPERLVINVNSLFRDFGAEVASDAITLFRQMAELAVVS